MKSNKIEEYNRMKNSLQGINTNRGGSYDRLKGFLQEQVNTTENNLERSKKGIAARELVKDDNGLYDAIIQYKNGQSGRGIQDKCGYTISNLKKIIIDEKYDGGILRLNKDHPLFKDKNKLKELKNLAKEHNIKIEQGKVSELEVRNLAIVFSIEGNIRKKVGLSANAPVAAFVYTGGKYISDAIEDGKVYIADLTGGFVTEELSDIHSSGLDEAASSAVFAATLSVTKNTVLMCRGEQDLDEGLKQMLIDTSAAYAVGYISGAIKCALNLSDTSYGDLVVNSITQTSKLVFAYVNEEIDEHQLIENIAESQAYLLSAYIGKCFGRMVGDMLIPGVGGFIGQYIGETITTAICTEVISTIKSEKEFNIHNNKTISLYKRAEISIRESQIRLTELVQKENNELIYVIQSGFDDIKLGIETSSYEKIKNGLLKIGEKFGLAEEDFSSGVITRDNLFSSETVIFD